MSFLDEGRANVSFNLFQLQWTEHATPNCDRHCLWYFPEQGGKKLKASLKAEAAIAKEAFGLERFASSWGKRKQIWMNKADTRKLLPRCSPKCSLLYENRADVLIFLFQLQRMDFDLTTSTSNFCCLRARSWRLRRRNLPRRPLIWTGVPTHLPTHMKLQRNKAFASKIFMCCCPSCFFRYSCSEIRRVYGIRAFPWLAAMTSIAQAVQGKKKLKTFVKALAAQKVLDWTHFASTSAKQIKL